MTATKSKRGRPRRSKNRDYATADAPASRCPKCDSTDRDEYFNRQTIHASGRDPAGRPYSGVELRRTRCRNCGQHRIDRTWLYAGRPPKAASASGSTPNHQQPNP